MLSYNEQAALELIKKSGMSLAESKKVTCPCGKNKGKPMGELEQKELRWFARQWTGGNHKEDFKKAIIAARIIGDIRKKPEYNQLKISESAKSGTYVCQECGKTSTIQRKFEDRARFRCDFCGGNLKREDDSPIDDYILVSDASYITRLSPGAINQAIRANKIKAKKVGRRWFVSSASVKQYAKKNDTKPFKCEHCDKSFRSLPALNVHTEENHGVAE